MTTILLDSATKIGLTVGLSLGIALNGNLPAAEAASTRNAPEGARPMAEARISGIDDSKVSGRLTFQHSGPFIFIEGRVDGLSVGKHGMHIHAGNSCEDRGDHYDPDGHPHGSPDQPHDRRHAGDLGNLVADRDGTARYARVDALARLDGPHSIIDRVLVIHAGEDDYASQPAGQSRKADRLWRDSARRPVGGRVESVTRRCKRKTHGPRLGDAGLPAVAATDFSTPRPPPAA